MASVSGMGVAASAQRGAIITKERAMKLDMPMLVAVNEVGKKVG